jgi:LytS/YehU family sensor histidine kinase
MSARMPRLQFSIEVPAELLAARCPPLMLISLAENAVKHGVEPKIGPVHVSLRAERLAGDPGDPGGREARLALTVADDGVGFGGAAAGTTQAGSGLGLVNIRERLIQLYGDQAALTLKARTDGGVAATLTIPLEWPATATHPA